ncbi:MAG: alpha-amylase family glycosyl hydrolase [Bacteroidia bacterium]
MAKKIKLPTIVKEDPWLQPYAEDIIARIKRYKDRKKTITEAAGSLKKFARAYEHLGLNYDKKAKGVWYREWAPGAKALFLTGDFNGWDNASHPLTQRPDGIWEIFIPDDSSSSITHESLLKVHVHGADGSHRDRLPAYIKRAVQDDDTKDFSGQFWNPATPFKWTDKNFDPGDIGAPRIYECHVGMATEEFREGTYREFADLVLPKVDELGYNAIQMMAVMEHPYYGSFGYHVSNFFAPRSNFGTPEDLKYLINEAHSRGIAVILDIVHSHAVKNMAEGLNRFDGTDHHYFHAGGRGEHSGWDSMLFDYGKWEVQEFLLSNLSYWMREFHFDGFRFDGVTSMLYMHHGDGVSFGHGDDYFKNMVEWDAITYLTLAMDLVHSIKKNAICIAEDMSGMPGLIRNIKEGGVGFDYRLAMGIPDYWIKVFKTKRDEDWNMHEIWQTLTDRMYKTKTVAYTESHDQGLVGDKTQAMWLMDAAMYNHMMVDDPHPAVERGIALHKMIRLITSTLSGEAYMTFMGNEFGHPEWIDFPREGNGWSYQYARRQWSLAEREDLKYKFLWEFDKAMIHLLAEQHILPADFANQVYVDVQGHVLIYERNNVLFAFNFHPTKSHSDYTFPVPTAGVYKVLLDTDRKVFGGHERIADIEYPCNEEGQLTLYLPSRTAVALVIG